MALKFKTTSGSVYFVSGEKVSRANEHQQVWSHVHGWVADSVFVLIETPEIEIGKRCLLRTDQGPLTTTEVVDIQEVFY